MREEFEKIKKTFEKKIQTIDWIYERVKGMEDNLKTID